MSRDDDIQKRKIEAFSQPFEPLKGYGQEVDASIRAAHALEYIAAQLGAIREHLASARPNKETSA